MTYGTILTVEHDDFVRKFQTLSKDAQCLLIRMVNRRGSIFNRTHFRYAEISDVECAANDLLSCGQARSLKAEDYASFFSVPRRQQVERTFELGAERAAYLVSRPVRRNHRSHQEFRLLRNRRARTCRRARTHRSAN